MITRNSTTKTHVFAIYDILHIMSNLFLEASNSLPFTEQTLQQYITATCNPKKKKKEDTYKAIPTCLCL